MKKKILIGFINKDFSGPIPIITQSFIDGLSNKFNFIPFEMNRSNQNLQRKFNLINIYYLIKHFFSWVKYLIKYRPDIVHFPVTSFWNLEKSLFFLHTAKLLGAKVVIGHLHGGSFDKFWDNLSPIRKKNGVYLLERLDHFIVLGTFWENFFKNKVKFKKLSIVNNPIAKDFEIYFNSFNRDYNQDSLLFVGSIGKRKGCYDIIQCFEKHSIKNTLTIIGPEESQGDISNIKKLVNKFSNKIEIQKPIYGNQKNTFFKDAGIFLFPSYNENFPLVIIEAACAGMPIITTPVGALPEFFTHMENIYFVTPGF